MQTPNTTADTPLRYCNDCAWPHECAAKRDCERRSRGEIRSGSDVRAVEIDMSFPSGFVVLDDFGRVIDEKPAALGPARRGARRSGGQTL